MAVRRLPQRGGLWSCHVIRIACERPLSVKEGWVATMVSPRVSATLWALSSPFFPDYGTYPDTSAGWISMFVYNWRRSNLREWWLVAGGGPCAQEANTKKMEPPHICSSVSGRVTPDTKTNVRSLPHSSGWWCIAQDICPTHKVDKERYRRY